MFDLMSAARGAAYRALKAAITTTPVYDDVPENTPPPFIKIGNIDSENASSKDQQTERLTIEVYAVYRGSDRGVLMAMLHAARNAIDGRPLTAPGAVFGLPSYTRMTASDASQADGVTFAAIVNFDVLAEPA